MGIPSTWTQDKTHKHTILTKDKYSTRLLYCTVKLSSYIKQTYLCNVQQAELPFQNTRTACSLKSLGETGNSEMNGISLLHAHYILRW